VDWHLVAAAAAVPGALLVWSGWVIRSSRAMSLGLYFAFVSSTSAPAAWLGVWGWWPPIALATVMWGCAIGAVEFNARRHRADMVRASVIAKASGSSQ
jgi:hypothetical protein